MILRGAGIFYELNEKVIRMEQEGRHIMRLDIGEPDLPVDEHIAEAAKKEIEKGNIRYGSAAGEPYLRDSITEFLDMERDNVIITPGSKFAIYALMKSITGNGYVMLFSPSWPTYKLMAEDVRLMTRDIDMNNGWDIDMNVVNENMDDVRLIILNDPNNPTVAR